MKERYYLAFRGSTGAALELVAGAILLLLGTISGLSSMTLAGIFLSMLGLCVKSEER